MTAEEWMVANATKSDAGVEINLGECDLVLEDTSEAGDAFLDQVFDAMIF